MNHPLCFILMPFGVKPDATGTAINFDAIYRTLISPAINTAGLDPIRADEEQGGGIIHKPMFERLILCEYAVADLTTANANVFYELGVRHAVRPWSTVLICAQGSRLPFDVAPLRAIPYHLTATGEVADLESVKATLVERLVQARAGNADSPIHQLVAGFPDIDHTKTDVFRDRMQYSAQVKERLAGARGHGLEGVRAVERDLGPIGDLEAGVVVDLFLSYRAVQGWADMIALADKMSPSLATSVLVQEQLALALNRAGQDERATQVLHDLLDRRGPSSETYGILGRVYKNRWQAALERGERLLARGLLDKAITAYVQGFEADWRDAYPGINALTLMELRDPPDPRREALRPVVAYAVERRISADRATYWDYATRLELAVLSGDEDLAASALADALALAREPWEPATTLLNLRLIRAARERRNEGAPWMQEMEQALEQSAAGQP